MRIRAVTKQGKEGKANMGIATNIRITTNMMISSLYKNEKPVISFEIFPPKQDMPLQTIFSIIDSLGKLAPDFISVTHGAGGSNNSTGVLLEVTKHILLNTDTIPLAHLTCVNLTKKDLLCVTKQLKKHKIDNILALKGDGEQKGEFDFAKNLIEELRKSDFCIGAACYPEGHISCDCMDMEITYLKQKEQAGADFFISQLFFTNEIFYDFLSLARKKGVTKPISAGVMPILSKSQIERMIFMCGASLPSPIIKIINRYGHCGESLAKAGVEYSLAQMQDLCDKGVDGVHIYTMNKPEIAKYCMKNLRC